MHDEQQRWRVISETVPGAAHVRAQRDNQDACEWFPRSQLGPPLVLAIADGHGSAKCFRSKKGAEIAVSGAVLVLQDFLHDQTPDVSLSTSKRLIEDRLPRQLHRRWMQDVQLDIHSHPILAEELDRLAQSDGVAARETVEANTWLAYGATLLAVFIAETYIAYMQLGDGDILTVSDNGEVEMPLPPDGRLFANETTSLSSHTAWQDFRIRFQPITETTPALILVSTDGYANSFRSQKGFFQVGSDILQLMRSDGAGAVEQSLKAWLIESSQVGSGDDITVGIMYRVDAIMGYSPAVKGHVGGSE